MQVRPYFSPQQIFIKINIPFILTDRFYINIKNYLDFKGLQINKLPIYYQNLLKSWSNCLLLQKSMTKLEVLDQPLYGNSNIVFNGKPIFFQNFAKSGIQKVRDIWDCETNNYNFRFHQLK
jgi:hypothetical protein